MCSDRNNKLNNKSQHKETWTQKWNGFLLTSSVHREFMTFTNDDEAKQHIQNKTQGHMHGQLYCTKLD